MRQAGEGESRRELFRSCARYALLAGLAAAGGALVARRGERCVSDGICGACGRFRHCALPQAWSTRRMNARKMKLARPGGKAVTDG